MSTNPGEIGPWDGVTCPRCHAVLEILIRVDDELLGVCSDDACKWAGGTGDKSKKWLEAFAKAHGFETPWHKPNPQ